MRRTGIAVTIVFCASLVGAQQGVNPPPRPLHKVGDHWTPYNPPSEFPADVQVYIIKRGDTLWDLARQFLGDPYLWPQLWEQNQYIRDAHWIYPGDPLVIGPKAADMAAVEGTGGGVTGAGEEVAAAPAQEAPAQEPEGTPARRATGQLVALGSESDIYCFAYLDESLEELTLTMASAEHVEFKRTFADGDIVFLDGGTENGVEAGQEYFLVIPGRVIRHPATGAALGRVNNYVGLARVLCAQERSATAEIVAACDAVPLGAKARPFEPIPIPMSVLTPPVTVCDPASGKPTGYITYAKEEAETFGVDHVVLVDLGEADQVTPGTILTVFVDNPVPGLPRRAIGELGVLTAGDHWSTAKVIRSKEAMQVGNRVEVK
ncbi:MAG: LysM peptidoglycan-binding domain-containing protein [Acidobacteriota bacterium]|jgi:LysM repeat protein